MSETKIVKLFQPDEDCIFTWVGQGWGGYFEWDSAIRLRYWREAELFLFSDIEYLVDQKLVKGGYGGGSSITNAIEYVSRMARKRFDPKNPRFIEHYPNNPVRYRYSWWTGVWDQERHVYQHIGWSPIFPEFASKIWDESYDPNNMIAVATGILPVVPGQIRVNHRVVDCEVAK